MTKTSDADIGRLDSDDPHKEKRELFVLPEGVIYLDGNSLGPPTKAALARLRRTAEREWGEGLIRSWNDADWINLPKTCGAKIARIIGAEADEVLVSDSVSVNLFKLAAALIRDKPDAALAIAADEFPTDLYVLDGLARLAAAPMMHLSPGVLPGAPVILIKSLVDFRTGAVADMAAVEANIAASGGAVIWDLCHAAGVLDIRLKENGARYAVGCGYKFLNGGPGAPAFIYVDRSRSAMLHQPIRGWMGHARPFDFAPGYEPADGVARFAAGTPPILSMAALDAALDAFGGIAMAAVEAKARALGDLFLERTAPLRLPAVSTAGRRGGQVGLRRENGYPIMQALIAREIIGDFRPPDLMRFGFSPLYVRYADVAAAADALSDILATEEWRDPRYAEIKCVP